MLSQIEVAETITPAEGIDIVTETAISKRVRSVGFFPVKFQALTTRLGLEGDLHPLRLAIMQRSLRDEYLPGDKVVLGAFEKGSAQYGINLYIGSLLQQYDVDLPTKGHQTCEDDLNKTVNSVLAHEVDHYAGAVKGEEWESIYETRITAGLFALAEQWRDDPEVADQSATEDILAMLKEVVASVTYEEYAAQPHEVRARAAAAAFEEQNEEIIRLDINPLS